jgi:hypothetical protein
MPKGLSYLDEYAESVRVTLSPADLARINQELPSGIAVGERDDPIGMNRLNRYTAGTSGIETPAIINRRESARIQFLETRTVGDIRRRGGKHVRDYRGHGKNWRRDS